jgi:ADP-heptose:LPS heptosyltransferase
VRALTVLADSVHQTLKRAQRRWLSADFEEMRLREHWLEPDPGAPFGERTFSVAPPVEAIETVVVFKADEIGDAVYALPALRQLREHYAKAHITLVSSPIARPVYERAGLVDEIVTYKPNGWRAHVPFRHGLRRALGKRTFDLAVYLRTYRATFREFRGIDAGALLHPLDPRMRSSSVLRAPVSLWVDRRAHMAIQLLEVVGCVTGRRADWSDVVFPQFAWTEEDRAALREVFGSEDGRSYVVLHPFAKDETRRYPADYWQALLDLLDAEFDVTWVSVGGSEDGALPQRQNLVQAQGRLSLGQTGYLLSRASAFIGNLSGPAHWSAALGVPTVTLMSGHSLPNEWAPLGTTLALRADVPCAPCHRRTCPVYGLACLTSLTPERVAPEISAFLQSRLPAR